MKGLELARLFYEEYGKPMIEENFGQYKDRIAVGLVGHGSECFGFDGEASLDHDFGPGFCIWLTEEDEKEFGFKLFRAYSKLPKEFHGVSVQETSALGGGFRGVHKITDFYRQYTGACGAPDAGDLEHWLSIPDFYLAEATNGEIFCDPLGEFSRVRKVLLEDCPEDVWLAKLASAVFHMAQTGQYNYSRCLDHEERGAAALCLGRFAENTVHAVYLLSRKYMPYYKWAFRGMRELSELGSSVAELLERLLESPYDVDNNLDIIEEIAGLCADEIRAQGLSTRTESYLEPYAYCIKNNIKDVALRNSPVML